MPKFNERDFLVGLSEIDKELGAWQVKTAQETLPEFEEELRKESSIKGWFMGGPELLSDKDLAKEKPIIDVLGIKKRFIDREKKVRGISDSKKQKFKERKKTVKATLLNAKVLKDKELMEGKAWRGMDWFNQQNNNLRRERVIRGLEKKYKEKKGSFEEETAAYIRYSQEAILEKCAEDGALQKWQEAVDQTDVPEHAPVTPEAKSADAAATAKDHLPEGELPVDAKTASILRYIQDEKLAGLEASQATGSYEIQNVSPKQTADNLQFGTAVGEKLQSDTKADQKLLAANKPTQTAQRLSEDSSADKVEEEKIVSQGEKQAGLKAVGGALAGAAAGTPMSPGIGTAIGAYTGYKAGKAMEAAGSRKKGWKAQAAAAVEKERPATQRRVNKELKAKELEAKTKKAGVGDWFKKKVNYQKLPPEIAKLPPKEQALWYKKHHMDKKASLESEFLGAIKELQV